MRPRMHHVGLAVRSTADALHLYSTTLGLAPHPTELHDQQQVRITFLDDEAGGPAIELLEPTSPDSAVGRFLEKRGEGMHHVCFEVDDLEAAIGRFTAAGYELVDPTPRYGPHGHRLVFLHPKSTHGTMIELYERLPSSEVRR